jgi:tight adherence protein C
MLILILVFIAVAINLFLVAFSHKDDDKVSIAGKIDPEGKYKKPNPIFVFFSPISRILLSKVKSYEQLRGRLLSARTGLLPEQFMTLKIIAATILVFAALPLIRKDPLWILGAIFFGFVLPDLWISHRIRAHKESVQRVLPETIDLLSLCIGAGLDFTGAVKWITEKAKSNAMIEELKFVYSEIKVGKPRLEALKDMSKRLNILDVSSFIHNLVLAERMGTPVEETFSILSEDMRLRRQQRGERQAIKAPIKILIPLIFCILPIIMIVVAGPVLIRFMQGGITGLN